MREKNAERVVVGLPRHMNGSVGTGAVEALAFVKKLQELLLAAKCVTWDERLTTTAANRALRDSGRKTRNSRSVVDQVAAQMILQGYLDSLQPIGIPDVSLTLDAVAAKVDRRLQRSARFRAGKVRRTEMVFRTISKRHLNRSVRSASGFTERVERMPACMPSRNVRTPIFPLDATARSDGFPP